MNHPRPEDLSAYVDEALASDAQRAIAEHLATCPVCAAAVLEWRSVRLLIRSSASVEPEPWFAERMESMVMGEAADVERWEGPERIASRTVFGLALLVLGLVVALSFRQESAGSSVDRVLAVGSGDTTILLASGELTREDLLQATIVGE